MDEVPEEEHPDSTVAVSANTVAAGPRRARAATSHVHSRAWWDRVVGLEQIVGVVRGFDIAQPLIRLGREQPLRGSGPVVEVEVAVPRAPRREGGAESIDA